MPGTKRFDEDTGLRVINFQSCRGGGGVWLDDKLLPDPITTRLVCRARIIRERSQARLITKKKRNGNNRENEGPSKNNVRSFRSIRRRITLHRFQFFSNIFLEFFQVFFHVKKRPIWIKNHEILAHLSSSPFCNNIDGVVESVRVGSRGW